MIYPMGPERVYQDESKGISPGGMQAGPIGGSYERFIDEMPAGDPPNETLADMDEQQIERLDKHSQRTGEIAEKIRKRYPDLADELLGIAIDLDELEIYLTHRFEIVGGDDPKAVPQPVSPETSPGERVDLLQQLGVACRHRDLAWIKGKHAEILGYIEAGLDYTDVRRLLNAYQWAIASLEAE